MKRILLNTVQKTRANYKKYYALVDDEDFERVNEHLWNVAISEHNKYAKTKVNGKTVRMHQFITGYKITDHINHDGLDNQKHNLRDGSNGKNSQNIRIQKRKKSSRYKGVSWHKGVKKWSAQVQPKTGTVCLGYFDNEDKAALAYNKAAVQQFGEYAYLNKVSSGA